MNNRLRYFPIPLIFVVFLCASTFVAYSQQQPAEKSPGSISGRLTSSQKPLSGIVVQLLGPPRPGQYQKTEVAKVVSTDAGNYDFQSVAPGTYDILPVTGAYVFSEMTQTYQPGRTVTVASGEHVSSINFELGLAATIKGQIKDADGNPVASEQIELLVVEKDTAQSHFPARGITVRPSDAQGNFTIDNVPPGRYLLGIERPEISSMSGRRGSTKRSVYPLTYYPAAHDPRSATVIEVAPGAALNGINITVGTPLKTYQAVGRVIDEKTGAPIEKIGFDVHFRAMNGAGIDTNTWWTSDASGQFIVNNALPGHFVLRPVVKASDSVYGDPVEFDIIDNDVTGLEVKMHHGATLSGKVIVEGATAASDMERLIKQNYSLLLQPAGTQSLRLLQGKLDADGNFQIVGARPGPVKLYLQSGFPGGPKDFSITRIKRDDQDQPDGIEIVNGEDVTGLQITVKAVVPGRGIIRGEVKVEGGNLDGLHLGVNCHRVGVADSACGANLDARNRFVIEKLESGDYELSIGPMNVTVSNEAGSKTMSRLPTVKQTVKVTDGAESEVTLIMKLSPQ